MGIRQNRINRIIVKKSARTLKTPDANLFVSPELQMENSIVRRLRKTFAEEITSKNQGQKRSSLTLGRKEKDLLEKVLMSEIIEDIISKAEKLPASINTSSFAMVPKEPTRETNDFIPFLSPISNGFFPKEHVFRSTDNDRVYSFLWELQDNYGNAYLDVEGSYVAVRNPQTKEIELRGFRFQSKELGQGRISPENPRLIKEKTTQNMEANLEKILKSIQMPQPLPASLKETLESSYGSVHERPNKAKIKNKNSPGKENRDIQLKLKQNTNRLIKELEKTTATPEFYILEGTNSYTGQPSADREIVVTGNNNFSLKMKINRREKDGGVQNLRMELLGIDKKLVETSSYAEANKNGGRYSAIFTLGNNGNIIYYGAKDDRVNLIMENLVSDIYNIDKNPEQFEKDIRKIFNV